MQMYKRGEKEPLGFNGVKFSAQGDKKFKEKPAAKWNKGKSDLRSRPHPTKLPTCEKELMKHLGPDIVAHTLNSSTLEAKAGGSLSQPCLYSMI